jgi:hypothetical protein
MPLTGHQVPSVLIDGVPKRSKGLLEGRTKQKIVDPFY